MLIMIIYVWINNKPKVLLQDWHNPRINPLEIAYANNLYNTHLRKDYTLHLVAEIIMLSIKGYIIIKKTETKKFIFGENKYELIKGKESDSHLNEYQVAALKALFISGKRFIATDEIKSQTRSVFLKNPEISKNEALNTFIVFIVKAAPNVIIKSLKNNQYIPDNVNIFLNKENIIKCLMLVPLIVIPYFLSFYFPEMFISVLAGISLSIILFTVYESRLTNKGDVEKINIELIKNYIKSNTKINIEQFETLLPYSIIFGLEKRLAKKLENQYSQKWYMGLGDVIFEQNNIAKDIKCLTETLNKITILYVNKKNHLNYLSSVYDKEDFIKKPF